MSETSFSYVRPELVAPFPPPAATTGLWGWMRKNLFASPGDILLTILGLLVILFVAPPAYNFLIGNAVWVAENGDACRVAGTGACWAYVWERMDFFIYGFYPVDPRFADQPGILSTLLGYWRINLVFLVGLLLLIPLLLPKAPYKLANALLFFVAFPIMVYYLLNGGVFGLPEVPTENWGGLTVTLIIGLVGIVTSLPLGILLALGRQSKLPVIRVVSICFIELWRSVPLITVLFMASIMLPLFAPEGVTVDKLLRALVGVALFNSAYMAEVVRGGLQAISRGQYEAAAALGLNYWKRMILIILPQALKHVIPGIVNTFIALFKDTSLVSIIGIFDLLKTVQSSLADLNWTSSNQAMTGYIFAAAVFWVFCFSMSRYSQNMERRLNTGHKR